MSNNQKITMSNKWLVNYIKNIFSTLTVLMLLLVAVDKIDHEIRGIYSRLLLYIVFIALSLLVVLNLRLIFIKLIILAKWGITAMISVIKTGKLFVGKIVEIEKKNQVRLEKRTAKSEEKIKVKRKKVYFLSLIYIFWKKSVIKYGLAPFVLFLLGVWLANMSLGLKGERSNVIVQNLGWNSFSYLKAGELVAGEIISGEFTAKNNNLGIVTVRFDTSNRVNNDILKFRVKENGNAQWYYSNDYQTKVFTNDNFFPFGFPKISNSMGKIYQWEIESVNGKKGDAVMLSKNEPVLQVKYEFIQKEIASSPKTFTLFLIKRVGDIINNTEYLPLLAVFFSPFIVYLIGIIFSLGVNVRRLILVLILFLVVLNIFSQEPGNDYVFATITLLWLIANFIFGLKGKISVILGLTFLLLTPIFLSAGNELLSERIAIWAYLFLLNGVILISCEKTPEENVETR